MNPDNKYEHFCQEYWLTTQHQPQHLTLTIFSNPTSPTPKKHLTTLPMPNPDYPQLNTFQTSSQLFNFIKYGNSYDFDPTTQIFTIRWKICGNFYWKDVEVGVRVEEGLVTLVDFLRIQNIVLRKKLERYQMDKGAITPATTIQESNEKQETRLSAGEKTERSPEIECLLSISSQQPVQKQSSTKPEKPHKQKKKPIRKPKIKLQQTKLQPSTQKQVKKRSKNRKITIETKQSQKTEPIPKPHNVKINFENGDYYYGEIQNNLYHGKGLYFSVVNGTFQGTWRNGKANGEGVSIDPNGNRHSGFYVDDKRNGKGLDIYVNGQRYEGNFQNDAKSGHGIYKYQNGDCYQGEWKDDMYHGYGIQKYNDGSVYQGNWLQDEKHSESTFTDKYGKKWQQKWDKGTKISEQLLK